jgi:hypothetical protein
MSSSTFYNSSYPAKNAVDLGHQNYFSSKNEPNQWLRYDFKTRRVNLTHNPIAAHPSCFLRSWVTEGSMDGEDNSWTAIDTRLKNAEADPNQPIATLGVTESNPYRFIRLRQNWEE